MSTTPSDNNNSTNNQDNDKTAQLFSALVLYIVLGTIVFLIFIIIRPRLRRVFGVNPMSKFPRKYVGWIPKLFRKTSEDTISKFGLDVEIALLVHKTLIYMVACYTFFAIVFILPVDATASGRQTGMNAYTISNIAPTEMERYAVHILGIIFNTIITCFFVLRMYKMYALFRRREKTKEKLHNFTVCITQTKDYTPQEIFNYFDQIFPGEVIDIWRVEDLDSTIDLKEKRIQYVYGLENARAKNIGSARKVPRSLDSCLCCQPCCCLAKKVPAEDFYLDRINTIENEIQEKQVNANYTKIVYVTFRHISTAMECVQLFMIMGRPHMAPELYDVRWKNHSISYRTIAPRSWITGIILLFLFLFWTAIIAFATTFSNINTLANYIPPLGLIPVEAKAFIGSIVPPIIIILSFTILKFIITALMDKTGPLSHSRLDRYVFRKLFLFYAINVFLVSLLANTFLETWNKIVNTTTALSPIDILLLLASSVGVQSTFFMIYILAQSFTHIIGLLHLGDIIVGGFKRWRAVTPREKLAASLPSHYPFHIDMAKQCLIFLVILNFSTISPLILPIGLVYLCFIYFQVAFDTTYTSFQEYDGFGSIFPDIAHRILFSLFFHQILMAGMFIISTFYIGLIFCGLCVIGTALFIYYTLGYYEKVSKYGLVDDVIGDARKVMKRGTDGRGYVHPGMWDATIDLEDVNRLSYSIKTAQNQGVEAP